MTSQHGNLAQNLYPTDQSGGGLGRADSAQELETFRAMMDCIPINVMMCDPIDFKINYANRMSIETLRKLEDFVPIKADELVGTCIDVFHKTPSHQRRLLSDPANLPHEATIKLGDELLNLLVSPIFSSTGDYLGPVLRPLPRFCAARLCR